METFLGRAAQQIFSSYHLNELQHLKIILPSRRAVLYFKKELGSLSAVPFFSPEISSIDDFIQETSGLRAIDTIDLYFEIYSVWKQLDPNQSFEKFLTWVPTLMKDFDLIDASLIEKPHLLFKYMSEAEALNRWDITNQDFTFSESSQSYFTFFDRMSATYDELRLRLLEKGLSYTGLAYRYVAENIDKLLDTTVRQYFFVGLNAMSLAEEKIIKRLVKDKRATCLWDSDDFYMNSKDKAGRKLRSYKKEGKYGQEWNFQSNLLTTTEKEIQVYKLGSNVLQSKMATHLAKVSKSQSHALIVLDESDFTSLFIQLPASDLKYNISAGISFKVSGLATVLELFIRLLEFPSTTIKLSIFKSLLTNPLLVRVFKEESSDEEFNNLFNSVLKKTHLFIEKSSIKLSGSVTLEALLKVKDATTFILALKSFLQSFVQLKTDETGFAVALIEKLEILESKTESDVSIDAFKLLLRELIKNVSIPFEKEPDAKLHVMSMLETRCLDFEEVTFLSFLEGNLPSGKKNNSFMPFDAAKYFDLPLYSDQDAIMAYHFFRLLQRAKKVNLVYPKDSGTGVGRKEPSRFLHQIEKELYTKSSKIRLNYPEVSLSNDSNLEVNKTLRVVKTEKILEKIKHFLENKGLSPTSINEFFSGELGFYWKYIERIREREDDSADIGANVFGSIIHYVLETVDTPYFEANTLITKEVLLNQKQKALSNFDSYLKENQPDFDFNYGLNSILKALAYELIGKYYDKRIGEFEMPFKILAIEKEYSVVIEVNGVKVKVLGKIDKIERHDDTLVVIDYKTGKIEKSTIKYPPSTKNDISLTDFLVEPKNEKFRQLLVYNFLINTQFEDIAKFEFKFYSFRSLDENLILQIENYTRDEVLVKVNDMLVNLVTRLMDAEVCFEPPSLKDANMHSDFYELFVL